jgi:general secretion pathway protein M
MIERLQGWWRERTPREQGLLILLVLIAVPMLFFYGLVGPYERMLDRAHLARDADAHLLFEVDQMAMRISQAPRAVRNGQPVDALVRTEAEAAGFTVASIARDGDGALLGIDPVRSGPFFAWVAAERQRRGLIVTRLTARPNGDSTLSVLVRFERAR